MFKLQRCEKLCPPRASYQFFRLFEKSVPLFLSEFHVFDCYGIKHERTCNISSPFSIIFKNNETSLKKITQFTFLHFLSTFLFEQCSQQLRSHSSPSSALLMASQPRVSNKAEPHTVWLSEQIN